MVSIKTDQRQKDDFYPTPPEATLALLSNEYFSHDKPIWEPACGDGAISKVLEKNGYNVISSDLNDFGYGQHGIDFLLETKSQAKQVVTNPPFKLANQFVQKCLYFEMERFAILLRLAFLEGQERKRDIFDINAPARVLIFSKRLTIWRGDQERPEKSSGTTAYAWFIWNGESKSTVIDWI